MSDLHWKKLKGMRSKGLRCMNCNNRLLMVIWELVARQAKTLKAHPTLGSRPITSTCFIISR
jgi:hypothetical protein